MTYAAQQRLDGYAEAVQHAVQRKTAFDRRVKASKGGVVEFQTGQLVQVYQNKVALTLSTECKLTPLWSPPRCVAERLLNLYKLETLEGTPLDGLFHVRRLRGFTPREGTTLAMEQKKFEEALTTEEPNGMETQASGDESQATIAEEDQEERELEGPDDDEAGGGAGFFYDDEDEDVQEEEMGIRARVAARRRGHLHSGGGQME